MVKRKRCHHDFTCLLEVGRNPNTGLLQIGQHIAVCQHGALRDAGCAARVLQKRDVIAINLGFLVFQRGAFCKRFGKHNRMLEMEFWHHLLDTLHHEVDQHALRSREQVANLSRDHMLDRSFLLDSLKGLGKVLDDDQNFRFRILQYSAKLTACVERIDVHNNQSGFQYGK